MTIDFRRDALPALRAPGDQDYEREVQAASEERSRALAAAVDYVDRANATIAYQARVERAWQVQRGVLRAVRENDAFESDRLTQRSMPITEADIAAIHRVRDAPRPLGSLRTTRAVRENEAVQLAAVSQNGRAIQYIKNPSEAVQLAAVQQDGWAIRYIKNPSEAMQLAAVKQRGRAIQYIKNPSEAVQLAAVSQNGRAIQYIKNPSEAVQLAAVKQDGWAIQYIKNPSEAVQLAAVSQNGRAIQYIKNPSEAVQLAAVQQDGWAIQYIKNPTDVARMFAALKYGVF